MSQKTSTLIEAPLVQLASRYSEAGMSLLLVQRIATPVKIYELTCDIVEAKALGILEEFVLRAAIEIIPPLHWKQLAAILKVDERFVQQTVKNLQETYALEKGDFLKATYRGRNFYGRGLIDSEPKSQKWFLLEIPNIGRIFAIKSHANIEKQTDALVIPIDTNLGVAALRLPEIIELTVAAGLDFHNSKQQITRVQSIAPLSTAYLHWRVALFYDWLRSTNNLVFFLIQFPNLKLQIEDSQYFHQQLVSSDFLNSLVPQLVLSHPPLERWSGDWQAILRQSAENYRQAMQSAREHRQSDLNDSAVELLDLKHSSSFFEEITHQAQESILVLCEDLQQLTEQSTKFHLEALASQHVFIVFLLPPELEPYETLAIELGKIRMPEGIPAISFLPFESSPFFAVLDSEFLILPIFGTIDDSAQAGYLQAFIKSNQTAILGQAMKKIEQVLPDIKSYDSLWTRLALAFVLDKFEGLFAENFAEGEAEIISEFLWNNYGSKSTPQLLDAFLLALDTKFQDWTSPVLLENLSNILNDIQNDEGGNYEQLLSRHQSVLAQFQLRLLSS